MCVRISITTYFYTSVAKQCPVYLDSGINSFCFDKCYGLWCMDPKAESVFNVGLFRTEDEEQRQAGGGVAVVRLT